jgi:HK97 family phage prohead protease
MTDIVTADVTPARQFQIFTGILKAKGSPEEGMSLSGVASSSVKDLHGDTILETAIRDMEMQAKQGLTIFLNHEYKVPEDVAGSTTDARVVQRGTDSKGSPVWDLDLDIDINDTNPRAVDAWRAIKKKGTKLGLSIGANIPDGGWERDDDGHYIISHVNLLETSIVGIPANPRSWISMAVKSLGTTESVLEATNTYVVKAEELEAAPPADDRDELDMIEDGSPEEVAPPTDDQPEADGDPEPEESEEDEPGVVPLEGETAVVSAAISALEKVEGEVTLTQLQMAVGIAQTLAERIGVLRFEYDKALRAKEDAERERDEAIAGTGRILASVRELIDELGNTPLGRKTSMKGHERKLSHLEGTYGVEFMRMLEKTDD